MRALVIALVLAAGCGGKQAASPAGPPAVAAAFPAARWIPANPTYVLAARTMRDAQRAFGDVVDTFGMAVGAESGEISAMLTQVLAVDPLSAEAVAHIGIDLDGGVALFSDDVDPTFVVHLAAPDALQAFFDEQRQRGMVTQSVIVDGNEVFTTKLDTELAISWTVDRDWLWVHFAGDDRGTSWFTQSKHPGAATWADRWQAAQSLATHPAGLVGFVKLRELAAKLAARAPAALACARRFEAVQGAGIVVEAEGNFVGGTLALDLGGAAQGVAASVLAPPPGWANASAPAPLAAQWNLDLRALASWLQPCVAKVDESGKVVGGGPDLLAVLDEFGVRSGRAFVHSLDPDDKSGTGAIALDLSNRTYFARLLDQIPMRSKFESSRSFGTYRGKHLSVPFVATADYVLDDHVFLAAMGDHVLDRVATGAASSPPPVAAIDLTPPGLPVDVWTWLFEQAGLPAPKRIAQRLQAWQHIHFGARLDGEWLVIEAQGNRR